MLRTLGRSSPRLGRQLRDACDALGISYSHFYGMRGHDDAELRACVGTSSSWTEALRRLGYAKDGGSSRATIRARARSLGIETGHLDLPPARPAGHVWPFQGSGEPKHLRRAAALLVASRCTLLGHDVSWPLEPSPYDLLLDAAAVGILRVQVKSGTRRVNGSWTVWITRGGRASDGSARRRYSTDEIDYFGVVDGDQSVYMIPVQVVEGQTAISLRRYEQYRLLA